MYNYNSIKMNIMIQLKCTTIDSNSIKINIIIHLKLQFKSKL